MLDKAQLRESVAPRRTQGKREYVPAARRDAAPGEDRIPLKTLQCHGVTIEKTLVERADFLGRGPGKPRAPQAAIDVQRIQVMLNGVPERPHGVSLLRHLSDALGKT
jgi:hypothetical protein